MRRVAPYTSAEIRTARLAAGLMYLAAAVLALFTFGGCTVELHWHQGERHYVTNVNPAELAGGESQEVQDDR